MKILVDMNLSPRWCDWLSSAGMVAVHWSAVGLGDAEDRAIMSHAAAECFTVLTHDLDFGAILAATQGMLPSVVQIRAKDVSPSAIGAQVVAALRQTEKELSSGALVTVDPDRTRMRLLPLLQSTKTEPEKA